MHMNKSLRAMFEYMHFSTGYISYLDFRFMYFNAEVYFKLLTDFKLVDTLIVNLIVHWWEAIIIKF